MRRAMEKQEKERDVNIYKQLVNNFSRQKYYGQILLHLAAWLLLYFYFDFEFRRF
jgi:hypothetical protein